MAEQSIDTLPRRSPAHHLTELMESATVAGKRAVRLREHAFAVQIGLRAVPGSESGRVVESVLGVQLPVRPGQVTGDESALHVLWLSPDEFLVVDVSRAQRPGVSAPLEEALTGRPGQAVDLSANRTVLVLEGPSARQVLEKGCPADLHPRSFPAGQAIVTAIGPVPVILHRIDQECFRIFPRSSFAEFMVRWIVDAMEEFGQEEVL